ncbi:MAG: hypothetical protein IPJ40_11990 [Saprospirales bacterium]|nr:hypothetical protein [Saprospirales bacterium]
MQTANSIAPCRLRGGGLVGTNYYHYDHLGSITLITNANGQVAAHFDYTPYGEQLVVSGSESLILDSPGSFWIPMWV